MSNSSQSDSGPVLSEAALQELLQRMTDWELRDGKLFRKFEFRDFEQAFAFMSGAALVAESANHHPEWWNCYNRVDVWLTTHDAGGITERDVELAETMDALATA